MANTKGSHKGTCGSSSWFGPWSDLLQGTRLGQLIKQKTGKSVGEQPGRVKLSAGDEVEPPHWPHPFLPEKKERNEEQVESIN